MLGAPFTIGSIVLWISCQDTLTTPIRRSSRSIRSSRAETRINLSLAMRGSFSEAAKIPKNDGNPITRASGDRRCLIARWVASRELASL